MCRVNRVSPVFLNLRFISSGTTQDERHATLPPAVTNLGPVCWKLRPRRFLPSPSTSSSTTREWAKVVQVVLGLEKEEKEEKETRKRRDTMVVQRGDHIRPHHPCRAGV